MTAEEIRRDRERRALLASFDIGQFGRFSGALNSPPPMPVYQCPHARIYHGAGIGTLLNDVFHAGGYAFGVDLSESEPVDIFFSGSPSINSGGVSVVWSPALPARYAPAPTAEWFEARHQELLSLRSLNRDWDSPYDTDLPSESALDRARQTLELLLAMGLPADRVTASVEGGVAVLFTRGDRYADIEFLNGDDGEDTATVTDRVHSDAWAVEDRGLPGTLNRIREFLRRP